MRGRDSGRGGWRIAILKGPGECVRHKHVRDVESEQGKSSKVLDVRGRALPQDSARLTTRTVVGVELRPKIGKTETDFPVVRGKFPGASPVKRSVNCGGSQARKGVRLKPAGSGTMVLDGIGNRRSIQNGLRFSTGYFALF